MDELSFVYITVVSIISSVVSWLLLRWDSRRYMQHETMPHFAKQTNKFVKYLDKLDRRNMKLDKENRRLKTTISP